jgi:hypothetical protein
MIAVGVAVWYGTFGAIIFGDVDWYATGLRGLLSAGPLYDPNYLAPHPLQRPVFWDQAPSTALVTLLLLPGGSWLWVIVMAGATAVGLALVLPRVGAGGTLMLASVLILWPPVLATFLWANVNGLVLCLLAVAWRFPKAAGLAIGIAAAVKLVPVLAVAWLAGKRDWRGVVLAIAIPVAATLVVVAAKGPDTIPDFITLRANQWVPVHSTRWGLVDAGVPPVAAYAVAGTLAVFAWLRASFSLAVIAMLASIPALHLHYWTWLLVPFFGAWMPWLIARWRPKASNLGDARPRPGR